MSVECYLQVAFPCTANAPVARLARRHHPGVAANPDAPPETSWFLGDLGRRRGYNEGPKGGLSLWGLVGNYTHPEAFVDALRPFWQDLLALDDMDGCHVLVFYQHEWDDAAGAFEIFLCEVESDSPAPLLHPAAERIVHQFPDGSELVEWQTPEPVVPPVPAEPPTFGLEILHHENLPFGWG